MDPEGNASDGQMVLFIFPPTVYPTKYNDNTNHRKKGDDGAWDETNHMARGETERNIPPKRKLDSIAKTPLVSTAEQEVAAVPDRAPAKTRDNFPLYNTVSLLPSTNINKATKPLDLPILSSSICLDPPPDVATKPLILATDNIPSITLMRGELPSDPIRLS